jgi:hypothetical protein
MKLSSSEKFCYEEARRVKKLWNKRVQEQEREAFGGTSLYQHNWLVDTLFTPSAFSQDSLRIYLSCHFSFLRPSTGMIIYDLFIFDTWDLLGYYKTRHV